MTIEEVVVAAIDKLLPPGTPIIDVSGSGARCRIHSWSTDVVILALPDLAARPGGFDACHPCLARVRDAIRRAGA
jgi:hypothetical protein